MIYCSSSLFFDDNHCLASARTHHPPTFTLPQATTEMNTIKSVPKRWSLTSYWSTLKHYAVFQGRARRDEYVIFAAVNALIVLVAPFIDNTLGLTNEQINAQLLLIIYQMLIWLPSVGLMVRRLHDVGYSGKWLWLTAICSIASLFLFQYVLSAVNLTGGISVADGQSTLIVTSFALAAAAFLFPVVYLSFYMLCVSGNVASNRYGEPR